MWGHQVPSPGVHARASDKPGAISTMGFLSPGEGQALSPVMFPACLRRTPSGMCCLECVREGGWGQGQGWLHNLRGSVQNENMETWFKRQEGVS